MKTYSFTPDMTFREARKRMAELNTTEHKGHVAKLIWREGAAEGDALTYLWDGHAQRFGHNIDKEPIDTQIVANLINEIALDVEVTQPKRSYE